MLKIMDGLVLEIKGKAPQFIAMRIASRCLILKQIVSFSGMKNPVQMENLSCLIHGILWIFWKHHSSSSINSAVKAGDRAIWRWSDKASLIAQQSDVVETKQKSIRRQLKRERSLKKHYRYSDCDFKRGTFMAVQSTVASAKANVHLSHGFLQLQSRQSLAVIWHAAISSIPDPGNISILDTPPQMEDAMDNLPNGI